MTEEYNEKIAIKIEGWTQIRANPTGTIKTGMPGTKDSLGNNIRERVPDYHKDAEALHRAIETAEISIWIEQVNQGAYQWDEEGHPEGKAHFYSGPGRIKAAMYSALCQYVDTL